MYNKKSQIVASLIKDGGSAKFASVLAEVEQKMLKTGNPLRNAIITKLVDYNMLLNANYQNQVNNALIREGKDANFVAKEKDRKSTRLNSSHVKRSRMPSSA